MAEVLIVEDEMLLNEAYSTLLQKEGYKTHSAFNGEEALRFFDERTPDLVLLDLRMQKMDGIEFLENLQMKKNYPKLKVIVFSNYDKQSDTEKAFKLGACRYMLKAWASPRELAQVVRDTIKAK